MQFRVTVQREGPSPKGFSPQNVQAQVGDSIFWFNADKKTKHQPYLVVAGDWVEPIGFQNPSTQVNLDTAGTYHYACALHPDEQGVILVCTPVLIGPTGTGSVAFNPQSQQTPQGTSVSWGNSDAGPHWPMPVGGAKNAWLAQAISSGDISAPVQFDGVPANLNYQCALHPGETGVVQIQTDGVIVTIGPGAVPPSVAFGPEVIQIVPGQSVTWSNTDSRPHQPAPDGGPDQAWLKNQIPGAPSPTQPTSAAFQFSKAGCFRYHCVLHPNEKGIVQVGQS